MLTFYQRKKTIPIVRCSFTYDNFTMHLTSQSQPLTDKPINSISAEKYKLVTHYFEYFKQNSRLDLLFSPDNKAEMDKHFESIRLALNALNTSSITLNFPHSGHYLYAKSWFSNAEPKLDYPGGENDDEAQKIGWLLTTDQCKYHIAEMASFKKLKRLASEKPAIELLIKAIFVNRDLSWYADLASNRSEEIQQFCEELNKYLDEALIFTPSLSMKP